MLLLTPQANAVESSGVVSRIFPNGNNVYFRLKNDTCINSATNDYYYIDMVNQKPAASNWFAMLLAASATGKPVRVSVEACGVAGNTAIRYIYQDF